MSALELLEKRIKASAWLNLFLTLVAAGVVVLLIAAIVQTAHGGKGEGLAFMVIGVVVFVGCTWMFANETRTMWNPKQSRLYVALTGDVSPIFWAHQTRGRSTSLKVYFSDGGLVTVHGNAKQCDALFDFVRQKAPHALLGYGTAQEARWLEEIRRTKTLAKQ